MQAGSRNGVERRLAAILAADVAGYSRLMGRDEQGTLAELLRDQGRSADAMALLQPVYDRFTEGFGTADLKAAKALLTSLSNP
jgi:predicted ATPase